MKRITSLLFLSCFAILQVKAAETMLSDTTFRFHNRLINLEDSVDQIKVKIYEISSRNDTTPFKQVYEGIYSEEKSYEKFTVMEDIGFQFPIITKAFTKRHRHYDMEPHWAGVGFGFAYVTDPNDFSLTPVNGFELKSEDSYEVSINIFEKIMPVFRNNIGITTGMGFNSRKYYLDNNKHLVETNGVTSAVPAPDDINYKYSRLKVVYLTFPLLIEFQPTFGNNHTSYVAVGVVGGVKLLSSSKVKYKDAEGHTIRDVEAKGLNVAPLTLDYLVQAGIGDFSVYAKYSPFNLFQQNKGPEVRPISLGLILDF
ncbi:MAG: outer membrane beta-barrel protein [Bacteroidales bacterium]|nr:outer membrane beta-barrel protein [Bacteroidales bacterium]